MSTPSPAVTTDAHIGVVTDVEGRLFAEPGFEVHGADADTPRETQVARPSRVLGDRYRLGPQVGAGGYGAVFAAEDQRTRQAVAIKLLSPAASRSREMLVRFHREAIAASRIRHPHVVDIVDFDVCADGSHYIVMEYLDGSDLSRVLDHEGPLAAARALAIVAQCARGLAAAHRVGILHRDLKPANIFLVRGDTGRDSVKIIDFGISKLTPAAGDYTDLTTGSKVVGTPCYMSPEQARGLELDGRCDVYALGIVLFEILTGKRPFTGRSSIEILTRHAKDPRLPPSSVRAELAACPGLDALVVRAMAANRAGRFESMEVFAEEVLRCLRAIDPVAADRVTAVTQRRLVPAPRRRLAWVLAVVTGSVGIAIALAAARPAVRDGVPTSPPVVAVTTPVLVAVPVPVSVPEVPVSAPERPVRVVPAVHVVTVTSSPSGAAVYRDRDRIGTTPLQLELAPGIEQDELTVVAPGRRRERVVVDRTDDRVRVVLRARPARVRADGAADLGVGEW